MFYSNEIVLDVDGVLLDCDGGFAKVASVVLDRPIERQTRSYDMKQRYGLTPAETSAVWEAMEQHEAGWKGFDALPGARNAFFRLRAMGHGLHLVTAIPEAIRLLREECLQSHGMTADSIHCAGHMHASKSAIVQQINPVIIVDDRLSHLQGVPFVPYRVWVDNGDEQDGLVVDEEIIQVKALDKWVDAWELIQGKNLRKSFGSINGGLGS